MSQLPLISWLGDRNDSSEVLCFSQYMQQCLYHKDHGYYARAEIRQGRGGDYYTAPSIGRLFARSFALHLAPILKQHPHWILAELGPGQGDLCCDLILALAELAIYPHYLCVEPQQACWPMQQQHCQNTLPETLSANIQWCDTLPDTFRGIVVANEILDALACGLVYSDADKNLFSMGVHIQQSVLAWQKQPLSAQHERLFRQRNIPHYAHYRYELPDYSAWITNISAAVEEGLVYVFDYGYPRRIFYHEERMRGTLMCFDQHRAHDNPLLNPGEQDISVHVEFTSLAEEAHCHGLAINLYTTLAQFLQSTVCQAFTQLQAQSSAGVLSGLHLERHYLLHPEAMGDTMKVMVLARQRSWYDEATLAIDLCHTL